MPLSKTRRRRLCERPPLFRGPYPPVSPDLDVLWDRHLRSGRSDAAVESRMVELYAPLPWIIAARMRRLSPDFYNGSVEEMASDGLVGLLSALRRVTLRESFRAYAVRAIKRRITNGQIARSGVSDHRHRGDRVIARERAAFVQEHGRMPERDELLDRLRGMLTNPNFHIDAARPPKRFSDFEGDGDDADARPLAFADARAASPDARLIESETVEVARRALRAMAPADRKIFKMLMRGVCAADIARKLGVSRQRVCQRINGVLWEARSRSELALHFGIVAAETTRPTSRNAAQRHSPNPGAARVLAG